MVALHNEEDVKIHALPGVLASLGYRTERIAYNQTLEARQGRKKKDIYADAVVFEDAARTVPLVVVETKGPNESLTDDDRDQAVSYARLMTPIAPLALLYNGSEAGLRAFDVFTKELLTGGLPREADAVALASRTAPADVKERLAANATREMFRVENVEEFKRILRASHNAIRNNEGYDPTKAFDELSKIMFCKLFEEKSKTDRFTLKNVEYNFESQNVNIIGTIFDDTKRDAKYAGLFPNDSSIDLSERTIKTLVKQFERYDLSRTNFDIKGEAFEHFLGDTFTGGLGQYFTPRNVVDFMVQAIGPKEKEKVIDPFCGTGGFLIAWHEAVADLINARRESDAKKLTKLKKLGEDCIFGIDWNERTSLACRMNMVVHGEGDSGRHIYRQSGFANVAADSTDTRKYPKPVVGDKLFDVCLTNPPFGSSETDDAILGMYSVSAGKRSIERAALAMERAIRLVKPGGRIGIIVMDGILNNSSTKPIRDYVLRNAEVRGLISLPPETFEGYGGRSDTTILFLERKSKPDTTGIQRDDTFMAVCRNSGYAANGDEIAGNELPEILEQYRKWEDGAAISGTGNIWSARIQGRLDPKFYWMPDLDVGDSAASVMITVESMGNSLAASIADLSSKLVQLDEAADFYPWTLRSLFREVDNSEVTRSDVEYRVGGVRWWGGGAFVREVKKGADIKGTRLNRLSEGQLVYNRLFAFRGSFAIVPKELEGAYVSKEFPTYVVRDVVADQELMLKYVVHALNSPRYLAVVDAKSSGSTKTSRNRFKQEFFNAMNVLIPRDREVLASYVAVLDRLDTIRSKAVELVEHEKVLRRTIGAELPI